MNKLRKSVAFAMVLLLGMQSVIVPGYALEGGGKQSLKTSQPLLFMKK